MLCKKSPLPFLEATVFCETAAMQKASSPLLDSI